MFRVFCFAGFALFFCQSDFLEDCHHPRTVEAPRQSNQVALLARAREPAPMRKCGTPQLEGTTGGLLTGSALAFGDLQGRCKEAAFAINWVLSERSWVSVIF